MNTAGGHFAAFAEKFCRHTKGRWAGHPFVFEDWQREVVDEMFRLDDNERRLYNVVLLGLPRKNGKSTMSAALALYLAGADGEPGAEVIIASGSRELTGIVFDQARGFVEMNPELEDWYEPQRYVIRVPDNAGIIRRVAADGRLQHGWNPNGIVIDELHSFTTPNQRELYEAMLTSTEARAEPLVVIITTAGYDKATPLGELYDRALNLPDVEHRDGVTVARDVDNGFLMWWYGVADGADISDPRTWMAANPASWRTEERLRRTFHSPEISEGSFRRLYANQWTKARDSWFAAGTWPALRSPDAVIPDRAEIYIGVDVGLVHDSTAVALAHRLEDGRVVVNAHVWSAVDGIPMHSFAPGGKINLEVVEGWIKALTERYTVRELVYDPRFFERSAQSLSEAGFWVAPLHQGSQEMANAYQGFYASVREGRVVHDGDVVLAAHVEATAAEQTERGWKIRKLKSNQRIDALVASVMAHSRAARGDGAGYVVWDG